MKRFAMFALPMLATVIVLGLGLLIIRRDMPAIRPRFAAVRKTVEDVAEAVVREEEDE